MQKEIHGRFYTFRSFLQMVFIYLFFIPLAVFGLDYVIKDNRTKFALPKYNNKVQNPNMFDQETQIYLPHSLFNQPSMAGMEKILHLPVISYLLYYFLQFYNQGYKCHHVRPFQHGLKYFLASSMLF